MKLKPDMELKSKLAIRIKEIRLAAGLSQAKFAETLSISRVHVARIEHPEMEIMPSEVLLHKICDIHNVNYDWLKTGEGDRYNKDRIVDVINTIDPNEVLIKQTIDYVTLKTTSLLKDGHMDPEDYPKFFNLHGALIDLHFRLMEEIKKGCEKSQPLTDRVVEQYKKEFHELLNRYLEF